jgi:predicted Zn-dependent protease
MKRLAASFAALALFLSCAKNPVTGKRELSLVSEAEEIEMGQQAAAEVKATMPVLQDQKVQAYVSGIGMKMARASERPNLPWSFTVLDDPMVNAFALPGGHIFFTRGILTHMNSEAELASVMGHEIGHVTARHSVQQISKQQLAQLGLGVGSILSPELASLGQLAGTGLQLLFLKYGRDAERQSDELGFKYMVKGGWDPDEMPKMFATLERVSAAAGGGGMPGFLSTHPDPGDREEVARERAAKVPDAGLKVGREEFLAHVNGMSFGDDPRQGFFKGNAFLHPELKFQLTFPEGWKTQNTPAAVVAGSPKEDAIIQLGTAGKASPEEAARKFLSQQGVQPANVPASQLAGLPPATRYFQAQGKQGVIAGVVSFFSHAGATFGIVGYSTAQGLAAYDPAFRKTIASFAPLSDPAALAVQSPKVNVVKVPRDMTIAEFHAQFPSTIPVEQVAIVNGVGKDGRLQAGQLAKQVVGGPPGGGK